MPRDDVGEKKMPCCGFSDGCLRSFKRFQFSAIFLASLSLLVYQTVQCLSKYLERKTGTTDKYVHISSFPLPELSFCPSLPYKEEVLEESGIGGGRTDMQLRAKWVPPSQDPEEFYRRVVFGLEELVASVAVNIETQHEGRNKFILSPNDTLCGEEALFTEKPYYFNGDCFAFDAPRCLRDSGILEIVMLFSRSVDIFVHHPGLFLSPNSRSRINIDPGNVVKIGVNHEGVQLLEEKGGDCVRAYDGTGDGDHGTFDDCMYSQLHRLQLEGVGCTVPWLLNKSNICVEEADREEAYLLYDQNRRNQQYICPNSCTFTNMYFSPPVRGNSSIGIISSSSDSPFPIGEVILYFRRDVKISVEYYLYSPLSMMAEIGGYVGLLMGVSLFKVVDINNFVLDYIGGKDRGGGGGKVGAGDDKGCCMISVSPPKDGIFQASNHI